MAMNVADAISTKEGKVFATIDGKTREFAEIISLEAKIEITTREVKVLGRRMTGEKATSAKGSGSIKMHINQSAVRDVTAQYIKTGVYPRIDIQGINHDPSVPKSRIVHNLRECIFKSALLNKLDADSDDSVIEETDFSFNDYVKM